MIFLVAWLTSVVEAPFLFFLFNPSHAEPARVAIVNHSTQKPLASSRRAGLFYLLDGL